MQTTSYRIVHDKDIIPHLPPMHVLGYQHHKFEVSSDPNYWGELMTHNRDPDSLFVQENLQWLRISA